MVIDVIDEVIESPQEPKIKPALGAASVIIRYHEIALKRGNRRIFVARLVNNLRAATRDMNVGEPVSRMGRIEVPLPDPDLYPQVCERIDRTFGIANYSLARPGSRDLPTLIRQIIDSLDPKGIGTFVVKVKRSDKTFPGNSPEIAGEIGHAIIQATGAGVSMGNPQTTVLVEILPRHVFYSVEKKGGRGGLPVGTGGTAVCLLSGGIDSPVAALRMMQRGCRVHFVHFHSEPYLDTSSREKVEELVELITRFQYKSKLFLVPFGDIQREVVLAVQAPYRVVIYRRLMVRIAQAIGRRLRVGALITGESLGQVASQTLENIRCIDSVAEMPILRPLIGMDKEEISREARSLGTFEISILPDQDCCQLFIPRKPATKVRSWVAENCEKELDIEGLVARGMASAVEKRFRYPAEP